MTMYGTEPPHIVTMHAEDPGGTAVEGVEAKEEEEDGEGGDYGEEPAGEVNGEESEDDWMVGSDGSRGRRWAMNGEQGVGVRVRKRTCM